MTAATPEIQTFVSAPFQENAYVCYWPGRADCLVVDPSFETAELLAFLAEHQLQPAAILNTHGHCDHIAGNETLKQQFPQAPLIIGEGEKGMLLDPARNLSAFLGEPIVSPPADQTVRHGEVLKLAGFELEVRDLPGHSPGHVIFVCAQSQPGFVLGGDTLFSSGIGRTDFPGGNHRLLISGIRSQLFSLPDDTIVYPGHNEATTVGEEKRTNPYLQ